VSWVAPEAGAHPVRDVPVADADLGVGAPHRTARTRSSERARVTEAEGFTGLHEAERELHGPTEGLVEEAMARRARGCHERLDGRRAEAELVPAGGEFAVHRCDRARAPTPPPEGTSRFRTTIRLSST